MGLNNILCWALPTSHLFEIGVKWTREGSRSLNCISARSQAGADRPSINAILKSDSLQDSTAGRFIINNYTC